MSAVDEALAELKKAEELLAAAKAVDAAELPKADEASTAADEPVSAPAAVADAPEVPSPALPPTVIAVVTEGKRGPMIKNGKLFASVR